jgi:large subunit ribosomal protein L10
MLKKDKERIVAELADRLRSAQSLIVTDYRGLSVKEIDDLRTKLLEHGARFQVVKNTLTRRAAEVAGAEALLEYLDGPTAIAFIQPEADAVAVAKVLSETARTGRVLVIKGGLLEGRPVRDEDIEELAKLPPLDVLRGQVLGAVVAPLTALVGLFTAPLQNLHGLLDARIEQLGGETADVPADEQPERDAEAPEPAEPVAQATAVDEEEAAHEQPEGEAETAEQSAAEADVESSPEAEAEAAEPQAEAALAEPREEAPESTDGSDPGEEAPSSEVADATSDDSKEE